jgi:hypothetical protein
MPSARFAPTPSSSAAESAASALPSPSSAAASTAASLSATPSPRAPAGATPASSCAAPPTTTSPPSTSTGATAPATSGDSPRTTSPSCASFDIESVPTYQRIPSCLLALEDDTENDELRQSADLLREDGFRVEWVTSGDDHAWRSGLIRAGLLNPDDAACNPAHLLAHLARQLPTPVIAPAEVHAIDNDGPDLLVRTPGLTVRCRRVLICTNAYAPLLLPRLDGLIQPNRGQMLALADTETRLDCSYYAHRGGEYFRRPDSGTIVCGGWRRFFEHDERTRDDRTTDGVQRGLDPSSAPSPPRPRPSPAPVKARWSGTMAFTPDGLPIADRLDPEGRTWFIGGFNGHGMSMAITPRTPPSPRCSMARRHHLPSAAHPGER